MRTPTIIPRSEHPISRSLIDPDALKVLNRLHQHDYLAYLVGGSVRDLLLGRQPKDFDIGTSAHPHEVKKLFRNCWIIGRRFRLAHVRFGTKVIEVATFRRQLTEAELAEQEAAAAQAEAEADIEEAQAPGDRNRPLRRIHLRDNTFGTPEEDAFRRDFTVNALFYDIGTFSIIDYTGGLEDIKARVIRSIGDPDVRFEEDPVRMLRAIVLAARLDFTVDPPVIDAIRRHAPLIAKASPARLLEEFYKILRSGASERAFRELAEVGLLEYLAPELLRDRGQALWPYTAALDRYRQRFTSIPETLTNPILLGTLLVPLGFTAGRRPRRFEDGERPVKEPPAVLGQMPLPRRDVERLRQILGMQRRLLDLGASPRAKRALMHRGPFQEALTWLEIHGESPETLEHWRGFYEGLEVPHEATGDERPRRRRRRRRRRGGRRHPPLL
ncbi:MAG TPA: polynucleotide adenylyltransferase PcnB [Vicinamibacterales bacterium]